MPCDVWLYDDQLAALTSGMFEISETDHWGVKIDIQTAHPRGAGGGLGAQLTSPAPPEPVKIYVDDLSGQFSPASLGELHGGLPARLDVSLYPLPGPVGGSGGGSGGGGGQMPTYGTPKWMPRKNAPLTPDAISAFIVEQVNDRKWTELEGAGVRMLYETVVRALNCVRLAAELQRRLKVWIAWLEQLGIRVRGTSGKGSPITPISQPKYRSAGA